MNINDKNKTYIATLSYYYGKSIGYIQKEIKVDNLASNEAEEFYNILKRMKNPDLKENQDMIYGDDYKITLSTGRTIVFDNGNEFELLPHVNVIKFKEFNI